MKKLISLVCALVLCLSMSLTAFATSYTPSVQQKAVAIEETASFIEDAEGNTVSLDFEQISITSLSGEDASVAYEDLSAEDQVKYDEAQEKLSEAYDEILETSSIQELMSNASAVLSSEENYVCSSLFDVTFYGDQQEQIEEILAAGGTVTLSFDVGIEAGKAAYVAVKCDADWVVLDGDKVKNNNDGSLAVTFSEFCPIMVIEVADVEETEATADAEATDDNAAAAETAESESTESTGSSVSTPAVIGGICVVAAVVVLLSSRKKKN